MRSSRERTTRPLPKRDVIEVRFAIRRRQDTHEYEVDGKTFRFKPFIDRETAEKCIYAIEKWSKVIARGLKIDTFAGEKIREATGSVGATAAKAAVEHLFEMFRRSWSGGT
jgi:hypothetical protein